MSGEQLLRDALQKLEVSDDFAEAVLTLRDGTRLCFCHRVGEQSGLSRLTAPAADPPRCWLARPGL